LKQVCFLSLCGTTFSESSLTVQVLIDKDSEEAVFEKQTMPLRTLLSQRAAPAPAFGAAEGPQ